MRAAHGNPYVFLWYPVTSFSAISLRLSINNRFFGGTCVSLSLKACEFAAAPVKRSVKPISNIRIF